MLAATWISVLALAGSLNCEPVPELVLGKSQFAALESPTLLTTSEDAGFSQYINAECQSDPSEAQPRTPQRDQWYRFRIDPVDGDLQSWRLRVPLSASSEACVHWPLRAGYKSQCETRSANELSAATAHFAAPSEILLAKAIVLHRSSHSPIAAPPAMVHEEWIQRRQQSERWFAGMIVGWLVTVALLCFIAWLYQRLAGYLYFGLFQLFAGASIASISVSQVWTGLAPDSSVDRVFVALALFGCASLSLFQRSYLRLDRLFTGSFLNALSLASLAMFIVPALLSLVFQQVPARIAAAAMVLGACCVASITIAYLFSGSRRAIYLTLSLGALLIALIWAGLGLLLLQHAWLLPAGWVAAAGAIIAPIVLTLGLYRHYQVLAKERDSAREALNSEQRLAVLRSHYCRTTGLPKRGRLAHLFSKLTRAGDGRPTTVGVYLINLDKLSEFRRQHGRENLESAMNQLVSNLREGMDSGQIMGRLDDWELVAVVPQHGDPDESEERLEQAGRNILSCIATPIAFGGATHCFTASIGMAVWPGDGRSFEELLTQCDSALYEAQIAGGDCLRSFSEATHAERSGRLEMLEDLAQATELGQLDVHYQPVHDAATGELCGLEALMRWRRPGFGLVMPGVFIAAAENTDLIAPIGEWLVAKVRDDFKRIDAAGLTELPVAINISPKQLTTNAFTNKLLAMIEAEHIQANRLQLEITEDSLVENLRAATKQLNLLRRHGVRVLVDDFGVGYSSLSYLRSLPADALKIDRSFVANIGRTDQDEAVIASIIRLARALDLDIVAEGVETPYQRAFLATHGCSHLQGHLFGAAQPLAEFLPKLSRNDSLAPASA